MTPLGAAPASSLGERPEHVCAQYCQPIEHYLNWHTETWTPLEAEMRASVHDDIDRLWVRWGLEGLSPMQRVTVILRHVEGRPVGEVAAAASISPETVKTHLKRATRRLRALLGESR